MVSNQSAVAAIGFAVFFLPQMLAGLLPVDIAPYLPTSILAWFVGLVMGADVWVASPIAWAIAVIALIGFASWRMDRTEF